MEVRVVTIPAREEFTPAEVAEILGRSRQDINYHLNEGKIAWHRDYRKRRSIPRKALIEFAIQCPELSVQGSD